MYKLKKWKLTKYSITKMEDCDKWGEEQSSLGIMGVKWIILRIFTVLPYPNVLHQPNANVGLTLNGSFCVCKNVLFLKSHHIYISQNNVFLQPVCRKKKMLFCMSEMVNFLIGSIHTCTADQELVCSHTRRNQQEPHGRPGWSEWRKHAAFSSTLVISVTWTNSSSSPEVWATVSRTNSFPLKGIFPVSLNRLRKAEQEKNKSQNVDSCVKEALKRRFRRRVDEHRCNVMISQGRSRFLKSDIKRSKVTTWMGLFVPPKMPKSIQYQ